MLRNGLLTNDSNVFGNEWRLDRQVINIYIMIIIFQIILFLI